MAILLSGAWRCRPDPEGIGEKKKWYAPETAAAFSDEWENVEVPSCWNADPRYERYEGTFWYARDFSLEGHPFDDPEMEVILRFLAVNYFCRVWINGREIGTHEGGYLPFEFEVPAEFLRADNNCIVVMVENLRAANRIPGKLCDWFNYGGIIRDVEIHVLNVRNFRSVKISSHVTGPESATVSISWAQKEEFPFSLLIKDGDTTIAEKQVDSSGAEGVEKVELENIKLWHPDSPHLYRLELEPDEDVPANRREITFGIREIKIDGPKILLNGEQVKLKGVSLHEELVPFGRSMPREERYRDVRDIKKLGFNALRTAHYTHDEALAAAADEIGLLVLEEIPVYWDLDYDDEKLYETAASMVRDMIERDYNHPSVILWSVGNEVPVENPACDRFMRRLMDLARELDPTRIVTYVSCRFIIDKTRTASDACCINCYLGWYWGRERDVEDILEMARTTAPDKPWIMTEFGAGAKKGFTGSNAKFSEERQAQLLTHYIRTLNGMDWISGWFIWIYRDFRSPIRTNRHQKGFNRKGIVSETREQKLICSKFPSLIDEKYALKPRTHTRLKIRIMEQIERNMYRVIQPNLARVQRGQYNSFYRRNLD